MLLAGLLLTTAAHAFEPAVNGAGIEVQWEIMPVYWRYDDVGRPAGLTQAGAHDAVQRAFDEWNHVPGASVRYIEADATTPEDDLNVVYWADGWPWDSEILALTSTWATEDGEIVAFDISLNGDDHSWATDGRKDAMDLRNALTHEVGHALGLAHDEAHGDATMAPTASDGETRKRDLHRSDEDGARYLYPGDATTRGAACSGAAAPETLALALLGAMLLAAGRRRRRAA